MSPLHSPRAKLLCKAIRQHARVSQSPAKHICHNEQCALGTLVARHVALPAAERGLAACGRALGEGALRRRELEGEEREWEGGTHDVGTATEGGHGG
jgi:hypothetical protein